eukprot:CAMPEP_0173358996 /NCGR_PEP_ID=MMETSP1144-20121109/19781_1 /TAXON_ID=483371 /ORGANISM="non described non described, Strain CCMP2298" /LENGTH=47 /DNA_ID= /DNA_START= /DNA_END= /DNA_ORIENTATION=
MLLMLLMLMLMFVLMLVLLGQGVDAVMGVWGGEGNDLREVRLGELSD